jgi:hypothetical protein
MEADTLKRGTGGSVKKTGSGYVCARWGGVMVFFERVYSERHENEGMVNRTQWIEMNLLISGIANSSRKEIYAS